MKNFSFKMRSKSLILCLLCIIAFSGCRNKCTKDKAIAEDSMPHYTLHSFMGKPLVLNDSICEQIATIAAQNSMLAYSDSIISIGEVRWRISLHLPDIALLTSVQPDDPKMQQVIDYLNTIYGKPYDGEDYNIMWSSSPDPNDPFNGESTLVHLRRIHSEEGRTTIIYI